MKPVIVIFIDALKPESIQNMPFLNSLPTKRRVKTELGYSLTCFASMLTGVYPHKHLQWFSWLFSPDTSPYQWLSKLKLDRLPHNYGSQFACYKISDFINGGIVPYGAMSLAWWNFPVRHWRYFDIAVKKSWHEPNYVAAYPTIFDILRADNIPYEIVGVRGDVAALARYSSCEIKQFTYCFVGEIDSFSHKYGQDSEVTINKLKELDSLLEREYRKCQRNCGDFYFLVFSDHGHVKLQKRVDLRAFFRSQGEELNDYIFLEDSSFARFWFRSEAERSRVAGVLSAMGDKGFVLSPEHYRKYHVNMPDNRYGDLIFYIDVPYVFTREVRLLGKKFGGEGVSGHGFLPDYPDMDGVLVSNKGVRDVTYIELVDIMPSILAAFDIRIPDYVDGHAIWY
jgi:hypothetical protein